MFLVHATSKLHAKVFIKSEDALDDIFKTDDSSLKGVRGSMDQQNYKTGQGLGSPKPRFSPNPVDLS